MEYFVAFLDTDELPRAWAISGDLYAAKEEAERQLRLYLTGKAIDGKSAPCTYNEFTMDIQEAT